LVMPVLLLAWLFILGTSINNAVAEELPKITAGNTSSSFSNWKLIFSWQHAVSGNDPVLLVTLHTDGYYINSVSYAGQAMSLAAKRINSSPYNNIAVYIYYLANPAPGLNNIEVRANNYVPIVASAVTFNNVDTDNPVNSAQTFLEGITPISHAAATVYPNSMLVDAVTYNKPAFISIAPASGQTPYFSSQIYGQTNDLYSGESYKLAEQVGTSTMGWVTGNSRTSVHAILVLNPKYKQEVKTDGNFILSGGPSPTDNFCVDDDIYVYLNGNLLYSDIDLHKAGCDNWPINFPANAGAALRVIAIDSVGICRSLGPLWLYYGDQSVKLDGGNNDGCVYGPAGTTFYDKTFILPELAQPEPVILIPGIMGSWNVSGKWELDPILHTYDNLWEALKLAGYEEGKTLFAFPYEWRQDNTLTAYQLKRKIDEVKQISQSNKVDIVTHSMGGLVARAYAESDYYGNDIDQLVFLGTPHKGSPKSYLTWEGAGGFDSILEKIAQLYFWQEAHARGYSSLFNYIQDYVKSVEQLLPTYAYLQDINQTDFRIYDRVNYPNNYPYNTFLENINSANKISQFASSSIKIMNFIGDTGDNTINAIKVSSGEPYWPMWKNGYAEESIRLAGDGTVPEVSSSLFTATKVYNAGHNSLPTKAQKQVIQYLTGDLPMIEITDTKEPERLLAVRIFSPADFIITAPDGKRLGKDFLSGQAVNEIFGAFYSGFNFDAEFAVIPDPLDGEYKVQLQGTGQGEYKLSASLVDDNKQIDQEFSGSIAPEQQRDFNITYLAASENPISELEPIDTVPPVVIISNPVEANEYSYSENLIIDYTATDDFSGLASVTIMIDDQAIASTTVKLSDYSLGTHNLTIIAIDNAGNQAVEQVNFTIIDNVPPVIVINQPRENKKYLHSDSLVIDYSATDEFAGIATTTLMIDGREIATTTVDLFDYALGQHSLIVQVSDRADNQTVEQVKFEIIANIDSTISDIKKIHELGWLKDKIYHELLKDALKLLKIEVKYFDKEQELNEKLFRKTRDDKKLTAKQKQKLIEQYNKKLAELKKHRVKAINKSLDSIIKLLNKAKDKNRINQAGYGIILSDINYLRENL